VAEFGDKKLIAIHEKPKEAKSNYIVTGLYIYDSEIFDVIRKLKSSTRNKIEITDINNYYINHSIMEYKVLDGYWCDAGTFENLLQASMIVQKFRKKQDLIE